MAMIKISLEEATKQLAVLRREESGDDHTSLEEKKMDTCSNFLFD